jgi:dienelactone hydrolase
VFGYHPNGGYNLSSMQGGRGGGRGPANPPAFGPAAAAGGGAGPGRGRGGPGGGFMNGMPNARLTELSELDTMHVYDLVKKEYPIDAKRTYLFGYSAGGNGGYYIGGKYADNWAAIAIGGANTSLSANYPYYDALKSQGTPFMIYYGDKDNVGGGSTASVAALKQRGIAADLKVYPGVDHDGGPAAAAADAFDFFVAHPRK